MATVKELLNRVLTSVEERLARLAFRMVPGSEELVYRRQRAGNRYHLVNPNNRAPRLAYARVTRPQQPYVAKRQSSQNPFVSGR